MEWVYNIYINIPETVLSFSGVPITSWRRTVVINNIDIQLVIFRHLVSTWFIADAFPLPSYKPDINQSCFIQRNISDSLGRYSHVTQLLTCQQVELQQNEFVIDSDTLQLTLISIGVEVSNLDYTVTPSNNVRMCANQYTLLFKSKKADSSLFQNILGTSLMICTCFH